MLQQCDAVALEPGAVGHSSMFCNIGELRPHGCEQHAMAVEPGTKCRSQQLYDC